MVAVSVAMKVETAVSHPVPPPPQQVNKAMTGMSAVSAGLFGMINFPLILPGKYPRLPARWYFSCQPPSNLCGWLGLGP